MPARIRIIGCGSMGSGDDALGLLAIERVRERLGSRPGIEVVAAGPPHRVIDLLDGVAGAVIVDAVRTPGGGRDPGELVRVQVGAREIPSEVDAALSSHGFGLGESLGLAAVLGRTPRLVFLGLEAGNVEAGDTLSNEVHEALEGLVVVIENEVHRLLNERE